jgi:hypothetical protein
MRIRMIHRGKAFSRLFLRQTGKILKRREMFLRLKTQNFLLFLCTVLVLAMTGLAWALCTDYYRPAPSMDYVSQEKGIYDTSSSNLVEKDCRKCHGNTTDRHHALPVVKGGHCLICHPQFPTIERNCLAAGCHDTNVNGGHHTIESTSADACITCHNPNLIGELSPLIDFNTYPPQVDFLPTPFSCENCHWRQTITAKHYLSDGDSDPNNPGHPSIYNHYDQWNNFIGFYEYPLPINDNMDTHHMGFECATCHLGDPNNLPCNDPILIRYCERCHSIASLHSVDAHMLSSDGWEAVADPDGEPSLYRTFAANEKCLACHGGAVQDYSGEFLGKPAIDINVLGISPMAGCVPTIVTLRGKNFNDNHTINRAVELKPTDSSEPWKSVPILCWTDTLIQWDLPCWVFAPGNYDVTVKTEAGRSNKRVLTVNDGYCSYLVLETSSGPYGTWIAVHGCGSVGNTVSNFCDDYHGVIGVLTFTNASGTWIATKFKGCGYSSCIKVRFQDFYQDRNGNYAQDIDEPFSSPAEFPAGDYEVRNRLIYFGDEDGSGNFSSGDTIFNTYESNPLTFTLTDSPIIYRLRPVECGPGNMVKIVGYNFGDTQGNSIIHIDNKAFDSSNRRIKLWSNTTIKIRIPNYKCEWFHSDDYKTSKVWVTVKGINSNKKLLKVLKPSTCS